MILHRNLFAYLVVLKHTVEKNDATSDLGYS